MSRRYISYQKGLTQAPITTEYQDRFLPPKCYMTVVSTDAHFLHCVCFRSFYVKKKWIKNTAKAAEPSLSPKELATRVEDYTSVYKHDFRAWKAIKQQSHRKSISPNVNHGLVVKDCLTEDVHPPKDPPRVKINSRARTSSPPANQDRFLSTAHADYVQHKCQRTRPILPVMQIAAKSKEPFHTMTTMRADYRAWNTLQCVPVGKEETVCKKSPISPAQGCINSYRPTQIISCTVSSRS
ncbi:hypothetical protein Q5P01_002758 [Channa striata]|uniref:Uncharacterized protein n=1 Tax=Channa striata TaxID=64152 RepID=A0AA88TE96_CHASR|nr:hypothetical protein Q5P01_002758 [Channa striata]